jgi:Predicted metalloendopeptidase
MPRLRSFAPLVLAIAAAGSLAAQANQLRPAGGLDLAGMDRSVQPGDSFWRYANGTWLAHAEIPADRSSGAPTRC